MKEVLDITDRFGSFELGGKIDKKQKESIEQQAKKGRTAFEQALFRLRSLHISRNQSSQDVEVDLGSMSGADRTLPEMPSDVAERFEALCTALNLPAIEK